MKTAIATPEFHINGFSATQIVFDLGQQVSIYAKCRINHKLQEVRFLVQYDVFNDMMRFAGALGEKIVLRMVDEMMSSAQPPFVIHVKQLQEVEAVFTTIRLTASFTSTLEGIDTFTIEEVWPINVLQQAKNLLQHSKDFKHAQVVSNQVLNMSVQQLKSMYAYYLGLLELDITEGASRTKAQLSDARLFDMAKKAFEA